MTPSALDQALKLARGSYQRDIVLGKARLSGSDLRGKARTYGASYARSREALLQRLDAADVEYQITVGTHGLQQLQFGNLKTCAHCGRIPHTIHLATQRCREHVDQAKHPGKKETCLTCLSR